MNRTLLILLFFVLYLAETLNLNLSLVPGLSVKNGFLYLIFTILAVQIAVTQQRKVELVSVLGPFALYAFYAVCMWVAALWIMQYPGYSIRQSLITLKNGPIEDLMVLLIFFYALTQTTDVLAVLRALLWIIIAGNAVTVVDGLGLVNLGVIDMRDDGRVGGPLGSSNEFGNLMAFCLPLIAALWWTETGIKKTLAAAGLIVSILAFFMAASRGGMFGLAAGVMLGAVMLRKTLRTRLIIQTGLAIMLVSIIAVIGTFAAGYGDLILIRFEQFEGNPAEASSGRTVIWARLLGSMAEYPVSFLTGFGWAAYQTFLAMGYFRLSPHSTYFDILYNLGGIGLSLYLLISFNILRAARAAIGSATPQARAFLVAFLIAFLALLVAVLFNNLHTAWIYIWAINGLLLRTAVAESAVEQTEAAPASASPEPRLAATVPFGR